MKRTILFSTVLAALGLGLSAVPSSALPGPSVSGLGLGHADLVQEARMSRRKRARKSSSDAGNADMPSRRGGQQYGGTSGGTRR